VTDTLGHNKNVTATSERVSVKPQRSAPISNVPKERPQAGSVVFGSPLDYCGPVVEVPDLGPDDLDEHGMPKTRDKPSR
jgi:hypothetical protein